MTTDNEKDCTDVHPYIPNETTLQAFAEGERMLQDSATKRFASVKALFDDLDDVE